MPLSVTQVDGIISVWTLVALKTPSKKQPEGFRCIPVGDKYKKKKSTRHYFLKTYIVGHLFRQQCLTGVSKTPTVSLEFGSELCGRDETCSSQPH